MKELEEKIKEEVKRIEVERSLITSPVSSLKDYLTSRLNAMKDVLDWMRDGKKD